MCKLPTDTDSYNCALNPVLTHFLYDIPWAILPVFSITPSSVLFSSLYQHILISPIKKSDHLASSYPPVSASLYSKTSREVCLLFPIPFRLFSQAFTLHLSSETALVNTTSDLRFANPHGHLSALILLSLSAAFDTTDHSLLDTLSKLVSSKPLSCVASYLLLFSFPGFSSSPFTPRSPQDSDRALSFSLSILTTFVLPSGLVTSDANSRCLPDSIL